VIAWPGIRGAAAHGGAPGRSPLAGPPRCAGPARRSLARGLRTVDEWLSLC